MESATGTETGDGCCINTERHKPLVHVVSTRCHARPLATPIKIFWLFSLAGTLMFVWFSDLMCMCDFAYVGAFYLIYSTLRSRGGLSQRGQCGNTLSSSAVRLNICTPGESCTEVVLAHTHTEYKHSLTHTMFYFFLHFKYIKSMCL